MSILDALRTGVWQLLDSRRTQASAMTLTMFDYFLTLPAEVEYFWSGKWTIPRILFFLNRALAIFWQAFNTVVAFKTDNTVKLCQFWGHNFLAIAGTTAIAIVHLILALRAWSLYNRSKVVGAFLCVSLLATISGELYIDFTFVPNFTRIEISTNNYTCLPVESRRTSVFFIPVLIFEIIVFTMVVMQALNKWKTRVETGIGSSSLFRRLVKDSVGYFFVVLVVYIVNAVTWVLFPVPLRFLLQGYTIAAITIMGTRLLLNLRLEAKRTANGTNSSNFELETMNFFPGRSKISHGV